MLIRNAMPNQHAQILAQLVQQADEIVYLSEQIADVRAELSRREGIDDRMRRPRKPRARTDDRTRLMKLQSDRARARQLYSRFNAEYLSFQQMMQGQARQFTMVNNVLKAIHDTVNSSINNIK